MLSVGKGTLSFICFEEKELKIHCHLCYVLTPCQGSKSVILSDVEYQIPALSHASSPQK